MSNSATLLSTAYSLTRLTRESVAKRTRYLEWSTQPTLFKRYPAHLFGYAFKDHEALEVIQMARFISSKTRVGKSDYVRLNTPSAGNLHPLELYVHIRGVSGILSGIYHVDVLEERLVLISEIEKEGLEPFLNLDKRQKGMIFLLSSVYFRSAWKYDLRAWRYIFLDAGHQLEALELALALHNKKGRYESGFDVQGLNRVMGFDEGEHLIAVLRVGSESKYASKALQTPLMTVQATNYTHKMQTLCSLLNGATPFEPKKPFVRPTYTKEQLHKAISVRRSARTFQNSALYKADLQAMIDLLEQYQSETINILYRVVDENALPYVHALLDQTIVAQAGLMIFITAQKCDEQLLMQAGKIGHRVYIKASHRGLGVSGIGAFYDQELEALLDAPVILYALVVGNS